MHSSGVAHVVHAGRQALACCCKATLASGKGMLCNKCDLCNCNLQPHSVSSYNASMALDMLRGACRRMLGAAAFGWQAVQLG